MFEHNMHTGKETEQLQLDKKISGIFTGIAFSDNTF